MLITIAAVGKLKSGPERELFDRFVDRAGNAGRKLGLTFTTREFSESRAASPPIRKDQEAAALLGVLMPSGLLVAPR